MNRFLADLAARLRSDEEGAALVEYGLLVALIALVVVGALLTLGGSIDTFFGEVNTCVTTPNATNCP